MEVLLVLLVLAFPVIAIAGLVIAVGTRDQVRTLRAQVEALQRAGAPAVAAAGTAPRSPDATQEAASAPDDAEPALPTEPAFEPLADGDAAVAPSATVPADEPDAAAVGSVPPVPAKLGMGFEERLGTQWTVWVGGIALALGGFFLVRYSIEQGWFGPAMRVVLGALLALVLIALGEWARRKEALGTIASVPGAHIPSILTAAGTAAAYADVWAAYALYDFIGAGVAFVLLGAVALATLAAALLHGPSLAGLGLVGAYVTPLIVSTGTPNYWALYIYLAVVTTAALLLARARLWRWLAFTAVAFGLFWTLPGLPELPAIGIAAHAFHIAVGFALVAIFIVSGLLLGPDGEDGKIDPVSSVTLAGYLLGAVLIVVFSRHDTLALMLFALLVAATLSIAWRAEAAAGAVAAAALLVAVVFVHFVLDFDFSALAVLADAPLPVEPNPAQAIYSLHFLLGAVFAVLFGAAGYLAQGRSSRAQVPTLWATCAVFVPVVVLILLNYRLYRFEQSIPFAGLALLLATLFALATEALSHREPRPGGAAATAIFATGAVAALALALALALEKGWLTVALALMVPGVAFVADKRPLPALRILCGVLVVAVLARVAWEPAIVGRDLGKTPIFNWLLWGYGVPALAFWLGGRILRRRADDAPARMTDAATLLFAVLLAFLEVRHYMTGGDIYGTRSSALAEIAMHVNVWLALAIGLERLRERSGSLIHNAGALILTVLALSAIVFGLGIIGNPMLFRYNVGGGVFNLVMLGYLLPAALTAALALVTRGRRPAIYSQLLAVVAVGLMLAYLSLQVRRFFHGPILATGTTTDAEQYAYSAVWLAFGVVLLVIGVLLRSQAVRLASAVVVILTVLKVFFVDMRDLTGIWQAISFIGLGAVLMGIGVIYQRLLFPRRPQPGPPPPAAASA